MNAKNKWLIAALSLGLTGGVQAAFLGCLVNTAADYACNCTPASGGKHATCICPIDGEVIPLAPHGTRGSCQAIKVTCTGKNMVVFQPLQELSSQSAITIEQPAKETSTERVRYINGRSVTSAWFQVTGLECVQNKASSADSDDAQE